VLRSLSVTTKRTELPVRAGNPLPIQTVRDLLGIVRVLYAMQRAKGNHGHARELQSAGQRLRRALELAIRNGDGNAHAVAWQLANDAIAAIARVQSRAGDDLTSVVRLASERVQGKRFGTEDREARRQARIKRG
jgi:hypothetical protein